ncbi:MAG TPA: hypothetical protein VGK74_07780 [Symbiobacteriaceae bacterium]|jgi:hypothetical protein
MERQAFLFQSLARVDRQQWSAMFTFYLNMAERFRVFFPDDEMLGGGRQEFLDLPSAVVRSWEGMSRCVAVSGPITTEAMEALLQRETRGTVPRLWSFELLAGGDCILRVEDFTVCLVFAADDELQALQRLGVHTAELVAVNLAPKLPADERVVPLTDDEVEDMQEQLRRNLDEADDKP